jgi:hypothetical protein
LQWDPRTFWERLEVFRDPDTGVRPPLQLDAAMLALLGDAEPIAAAAERQTPADSTTWHLAAVTERHIVYVTATAAVELWDDNTRSDPQEELTGLDAWARDHDSVRAVTVIDACELWFDASEPAATVFLPVWQVLFDDGSALRVPPIGQRSQARSEMWERVATAVLRA